MTFERLSVAGLSPNTRAWLDGRPPEVPRRAGRPWLAYLLGGVFAVVIVASVLQRGIAGAFANPGDWASLLAVILLFGAPLGIAARRTVHRNSFRTGGGHPLGFHLEDDATYWRETNDQVWRIPRGSVREISLSAYRLQSPSGHAPDKLLLIGADGANIEVPSDFDMADLWRALSAQHPEAKASRAAELDPYFRTAEAARVASEPLEPAAVNHKPHSSDEAAERISVYLRESGNSLVEKWPGTLHPTYGECSILLYEKRITLPGELFDSVRRFFTQTRLHRVADEEDLAIANNGAALALSVFQWQGAQWVVDERRARSPQAQREREMSAENARKHDAERAERARRPTCAAAGPLTSTAEAEACFRALLASAGITRVSSHSQPTGETVEEYDAAIRLNVADFAALRPHAASWRVFDEQALPADGSVTVLSVTIDWTMFTAR